MRVTILRMIATNSLQAFSGATTTGPLQRPSPARLVREQQTAQPRQAGPALKAPLPDNMPTSPLPRGSLLNLSV